MKEYLSRKKEDGNYNFNESSRARISRQIINFTEQAIPGLVLRYQKLPIKKHKKRIEMDEDVRLKCVEILKNKIEGAKLKDKELFRTGALYFCMETGSRPKEAAYSACKALEVFKDADPNIVPMYRETEPDLVAVIPMT